MKASIIFRSILFALAAAVPTRAAEPLVQDSASPAGTIPLAVEPRATWHGGDLAPSSQLSTAQALALAGTISQAIGRDIIVSNVAPTGSMRPFFNEHSLLLLEAVPFSELKLGDVVTFYDAELQITVVHRLVEKRGDAFWSRGDHNRGMDNIYVTPANFRRRLVGVIYFQPDGRPAGDGVQARPTAGAGNAGP